uniref:F-box associated beta-propeller type 3 domain-containing protein n=2 Tax=Aegilops tauschii TaxID=37682 RepID=M8C277_AEGTA
MKTSKKQQEAPPTPELPDFTGEFRSVHCFCHCDSLVLAATDTKVYLFNPTIKDVVTLPDSSRNKVPGYTERPIGFGRDPRTGMYKVVRSLFGSTDCKTGIVSMGMEVCTVGSPAPPQWREIAGDQPYAPVSSVPAQSVKGCVYWIVDDTNFEPRSRGLLRFDLVDEAFNFISLPSDLSDLGDDDNDNEHFNLSVLHGELSLTGYRVNEPNDVHRLVVVWALMEDGASSVWEPRHTLYVMEPCHPIAFLPGTLMLRFNRKLCLYDLQSRELANACELIKMRYRRHGSAELEPAWKHVYFCNVIPYMESLVPVGAHMA